MQIEIEIKCLQNDLFSFYNEHFSMQSKVILTYINSKLFIMKFSENQKKYIRASRPDTSYIGKTVFESVKAYIKKMYLQCKLISFALEICAGSSERILVTNK